MTIRETKHTVLFIAILAVSLSFSTVTAFGGSLNKNDIEERIEKLEAIEAIKQLHYKYCYQIYQIEKGEPGRQGGMNELFSKDGILATFPGEEVKVNEPPEEKDGLKSMGGNAEAENYVHKEGQFSVMPIITVNGDKATGKWLYYCMHPHPRTLQMLFFIQGVYDAEYVKENGEWKISYLTFNATLAPEGTPPWE